MFQSYALFPHLTVRGNVEFGLRRKRREWQSRPASRACWNRCGWRARNRACRRSSPEGERQRVALARSLVLEPDVLLLDEPLSALDPQLRKQVRAELKDLQRRVGVTFLFVTHDQEEALSMSDRIAVMNRGRGGAGGHAAGIYRRPKTRFVASFLGAMNWIGGVGLRPEALRISREATGGRASRSGDRALCSWGPVAHVEARLDSGETCTAQITARRRRVSDGRSRAPVRGTNPTSCGSPASETTAHALFLAPAAALMLASRWWPRSPSSASTAS